MKGWAAVAGERILVVDDEPANLRLMVLVLRSRGYEVVTADDAEVATHVLEASPVDLLILDLGLPGVDGLALTRRLRADERWRSLPIVAWTGYAMASDEARARAAGCDDFLPKPVDIGQIPVVVARNLRSGAPGAGAPGAGAPGPSAGDPPAGTGG